MTIPRKPYILIATIGLSQGRTLIYPVAELSDVSHVRFLRGNLIGFAVRNGDDVYPYIGDWTKGEFHAVFVPNLNTPSPYPIVYTFPRLIDS